MNLKLSPEDLVISLEMYYSFTIEELKKYRVNLAFERISENKNLKWDYHILKEFEELWDWNKIGENRSVNSRITLGLLFPDRFELMDCDCVSQLEFCDCYKQVPRDIKYDESAKSEVASKKYNDQFLVEYFIKNFFTSEDLVTVFENNEIPLRFNLSAN